jgi:phosphoglycerol transferase MdoB-like AlkP superfamily enzyme
MGYAFLYGVFGSLIGFNVGSFMYARMIEPVLGTAAVAGQARTFWLIFAVLDVCAAAALVLFFRKFGEDTPATRRSAARAMRLVYALIILLGLAFLAIGLGAAPVQYRTVVQALIFVTLGGGGIVVNRRGMRAAARA